MDAQVAIVGGGPVGALLGNLLGRRGISTCIIEKQPSPYNLPRAIHFDGEAMRTFQATGLTEQILPSTMVGRGMLFKDDKDNVLIDWSREQSIGPMGWYESYRVHQPGLEQALLDGLSRFEHVKLMRGEAVKNVSQTDEDVLVQLESGKQINCRYVVGCDGATSTLRDLMGVALDDLGYMERWLVVDLLLKIPREDLGDYSIQFCDEENPATYVRGIGDRRRWEMRLKPDTPDIVPDELVWQMLGRWIGPHEAELERSAVYTFRSCITQKWRDRRCFLAGDAAHQMPPFMGQGMCAGIRDAANLAWKLAAVLNGAPQGLLDTYGGERAQNVRQFIELTLRLGKLINQTAAGDAPQGVMKSIWPSLGDGFGRRDGVGGELAPQVRLSNGQLADDFAQNGFYLLTAGTTVYTPVTDLPVVKGDWKMMEEAGFDCALIRPDGYAAGGFSSAQELEALLADPHIFGMCGRSTGTVQSGE